MIGAPQVATAASFNRDAEGSAGAQLVNRVNDDWQTPTLSGNVRCQLARRHRSPPEFAEDGWMRMESSLQRTPLGRG